MIDEKRHGEGHGTVHKFRYTHDANGNITSDGKRSYIWNQDNRLSSVDIGGEQVRHVYNGKGQRIRKITSRGMTVPVGREGDAGNDRSAVYQVGADKRCT